MQHELVQRIIETINERTSDMHTAFPAEIVTVDRDTGLAEVLPTMKKLMSDGTKMEYPKITGVPIVLPQGSNQEVSICYPVKEGDKCLVIISEESLEYWLTGAETDTTLMFDITNAICIPGMFQEVPSNFWDACDNDAMILEAKGSKATLKKESIVMESNGTTMTIDENGVTIDGKVTINGETKINDNLTATGYVYLG